MAESGNLSPRQRRAIAALMTSRNVASAARSAHVGERSLYRWLEDSVFLAELKAAESRAIDAAVRRLAELSGAAIDVLETTMTSGEVSPSAKVRAADIVINRLLNLKELADLEKRIAALEEKKR